MSTSTTTAAAAAAAPFTLSRASVADIPEMTRIMYRCFPQHAQELLMGCDSEEDLPKFIAYLENEYRTHHHAVWLKVVDQASGHIAAASLWKVYPNAGTPEDGGQVAMSWLNEEKKEKAQALLDLGDRARKEANPGGFIHLHICFTSPDYRRQGAGGLMMQWGCDMADLLSVPAWIEASAQGQALYKVHGFVDVETPPELQKDVVLMRREPKALDREGGHVKV